jgi:WD40 repeat protein
LATGDRNGNIRIYDLNTLESICMIEAHDGEILYLQYSQPESGRLLLASSSRDRLIHIFDASKSTYNLLQILDDHSAAITSIRFCYHPPEKQLYVISCGADKSIMFRSTQCSPNDEKNSSEVQFVRQSYVAEKQTFYDLQIDPTSKNFIYTISQDRMVRLYSIKDGKRVRQFHGSLNQDGYLIKMDINPTGNLLAASCSDKCVYIWDLNTNDCVAYFCGHSEIITDLRFTADSKHLITVSVDGCIFYWKLSNILLNLCNNNNVNSAEKNASAQSITTTTTTTTTTSWSKCRANSVIPTSSSNPLNLYFDLPANHHQPSIKHQQSLDTILDNDFDALPMWARNKLSNLGSSTITDLGAAAESSTLASNNNSENFTNSTTNLIDGDQGINSNERTQRRNRAVWGPPVLNTSFAIMDEIEDCANSNSIMNTSQFGPFLDSVNNNNNNNKTLTDEENLANNDRVLTDNQEDEAEMDKLESEESQEEEVDQNPINNSKNIIQFPSPFIDKDLFHVKPVQVNETEIKQSWSNDNIAGIINDGSSSTTTNTPTTTFNNKENNATPNTIKNNEDVDFFSSDYSTILKDRFDSKNLDGEEEGKERDNLDKSANLGSQSSEIKLECDIENSLRRQSLSAMYLSKIINRKTNQQIQQCLAPPPPVAPSESSTSCSPTSPTAILKNINPTTNASTAIATVQSTDNKRRLNNQSSTAATISSLYNQHTESSLSKTKTSQKNLATTTSANLKRSPSVSSLITSNENDSKSINKPSSNNLLFNKVNRQKTSSTVTAAAVSPTKNNSNENNSETSSLSSLKKASSMTSLLAQQQHQQIITNKSQQKQQNLNNVLKDFNVLQQMTAKDGKQTFYLPPKGLREVKLRQIKMKTLSEQQKPTTASTNKANLVTTFSEQNNKIRKLSSSIQNLMHNNQPSSATLKSPTNTSQKPAAQTAKQQPVKTIIGCKEEPLITKQNENQQLIDSDQLSTSSSQSTEDFNDMLAQNLDQNDEDITTQLSSSNNNNRTVLDFNPASITREINTQLSSTQSLTSSSTSSSSSSFFEPNNNKEEEDDEENGILSKDHPDDENDEDADDDDDDDDNDAKEKFVEMIHSKLTSINLDASSTTSSVDHRLNFSHQFLNHHNINHQHHQMRKSTDYGTCSPSSSSSNSHGKMSSFANLKKTTTFASIAASSATHNPINIAKLGASPSGGGLNMGNSCNNLSNEKVEAILSQFKQNIYILELIFNQVSKYSF